MEEIYIKDIKTFVKRKQLLKELQDLYKKKNLTLKDLKEFKYRDKYTYLFLSYDDIVCYAISKDKSKFLKNKIKIKIQEIEDCINSEKKLIYLFIKEFKEVEKLLEE